MLEKKWFPVFLFNSCYFVGNKNGTKPVINLKVQLMEFNNGDNLSD